MIFSTREKIKFTIFDQVLNWVELMRTNISLQLPANFKIGKFEIKTLKQDAIHSKLLIGFLVARPYKTVSNQYALTE